MRRLLATTSLLLALAPNALAAPTVTFTLSGTQGSNGWFRSNVTIHWTITEPQSVTSTQGCEIAQLVTTEGQTSHTCTANFVGGSSSATATPKIDKTAPSASGGALRGPDANGWYNHPVGFGFSGADAVSGIAGCSSPTYSGGDGASVSVSGTCTDVAGNTSAVAMVTFKYDATPPVVTTSADRPPDGAWYRRPLTVSFAATDATSGVASCTAPVVYRGPDGAAATVKGTCADAAGNAAGAAHVFRYDDTAPSLPRPKVERGPGQIRISWAASKDYASTQLVRIPGVRGKRSSVIYAGKGAVFVDRAVEAGRKYRYQLVVADQAGNRSGRTVTAGPLAALYLPAAGATVRGPVTLAWQAVPGATFYNLQLYRNGVKVLSVWPNRPTFRLGRTWRFAGRVQQLAPGRYVWHLWPAKGTLERPRFGARLGSSTFVVRGGR